MTLTQIFLLICICFAVPIAMGLIWLGKVILRAVIAWTLMRNLEIERRIIIEVRGRRVS